MAEFGGRCRKAMLGVCQHRKLTPHKKKFSPRRSCRDSVEPGTFSITSTARTPSHTRSIAFWHLPPNSVRFSYVTEGALFISAQLSTDAVSALRKVRVLHDCRSNLAPKHARKHETHPPRVKKKKKRVPSRFKLLWFYVYWCKLCWRL